MARVSYAGDRTCVLQEPVGRLPLLPRSHAENITRISMGGRMPSIGRLFTLLSRHTLFDNPNQLVSE
jgi:hypothetical protein